MLKSQPRGIIKWSPFNAIVDYDVEISILKKENEKLQINENQLHQEYIDYCLLQMQINKITFAKVDYFKNGVVQQVQGEFQIENEKLIVNSTEIYFKQIIDIGY